MASLERTMHETAVRALAQQESALDQLRARTGTVLTAGSLVGSFLGGQAIARNGLNPWVDLALTAVAAVVMLSVYALLPKRLLFAVDTEEAYRLLLPTAADERSIDRAMSRLLHELHSANKASVARVVRAARLAGAAVIFEIVLLGVGLA